MSAKTRDRFIVTEHALQRYIERIAPDVSYAGAKKLVQDRMNSAKRLRTTAAGGGEMWHAEGAFIAVCVQDHAQWVVKTILTEKQALQVDETVVDLEVATELFSEADVQNAKVNGLPTLKESRIVKVLEVVPEHMRDLLPQIARPRDIGALAVVMAAERNKWREAQITLRHAITTNDRGDVLNRFVRRMINAARRNEPNLRKIIEDEAAIANPRYLTDEFLSSLDDASYSQSAAVQGQEKRSESGCRRCAAAGSSVELCATCKALRFEILRTREDLGCLGNHGDEELQKILSVDLRNLIVTATKRWSQGEAFQGEKVG